MIKKQELLIRIKTLCDAIQTRNQELVNFAGAELDSLLNKLPDEIPLLKKSEDKEDKKSRTKN